MGPHSCTESMYIWVFPKIGGKPPKMDGLFHGKPYEQMDDLGVPLFLETPILYNLLHLGFLFIWNKPPNRHDIRQLERWFQTYGKVGDHGKHVLIRLFVMVKKYKLPHFIQPREACNSCKGVGTCAFRTTNCSSMSHVANPRKQALSRRFGEPRKCSLKRVQHIEQLIQH